MAFDPSSEIQDFQIFGEFGGVNPSITDSSTFTFMNIEKMKEAFDHEIEGCFLYARHWNPINKFLSGALAKMEGAQAALVTASGMAAICSTILQECGTGDHIVASDTIYGGTYAFFKNFLPRFGITVDFVNILDLDDVRRRITARTRFIYAESMSNPLLTIADIPRLASLANGHGIRLVIDNTFSPLIISPLKLGAHVVVHSLTKYINGTSDGVAGCICADADFISRLTNVNTGASMLLGPVLDSRRAASILKNLHSLHIRMQKHSANALYLARRFEKIGIRTYYPGLESHNQHLFVKAVMNPGFGFGGMVAIDVGSETAAAELMAMMQMEKVGFLAVSLGYFKTLFSSPSSSTSSEIPKNEQDKIGLSTGMVRISVGLDNNIGRSFKRIQKCLKALDLV